MKKLISIILIVVMATAIAMPIFAETQATSATQKLPGFTSSTGQAWEDGPALEIATNANGAVQNGTGIPVKYGVSEKFVLRIPEYITFVQGSVYASGNIEAINIVLSENRKIVVTVDSVNDWIMKDAAQTAIPTIAYRMRLTQDSSAKIVKDNDEVFTVDYTQRGETVVKPLFCDRDLTDIAGTYTDTLVFTADIQTGKAN